MAIVKTMSPQFISTVVGAGIGGAALEGNDDNPVGAVLGLGIGGVAGSLFDFEAPNFTKSIKKDFDIKVEKADSEVIKLKKELHESVRQNGKNLLDGTTDFNKNDVFGTLTKHNAIKAIDDTNDVNTLKSLLIAVKNPNKFEKLQNTSSVVVNNKIQTVIAADTPADVKKEELEKWFRKKGYQGQELDTKLTLFSGLLDKEKNIIMDSKTNDLTIGGEKFRVTAYSENNKFNKRVGYYADELNFYTTRKINPFIPMFNSGLDENAIANVLGISLSMDASGSPTKESQAILDIISDSKINGMRPEDLQALSSRIKGVDNKAIEALVDSAYQHRHAESGFLGSGINSEKIAKDMLSEESVRWSEHIDGGKSFDFDMSKGTLREGGSGLRNTSTKAKNNLSEINQFYNNLGLLDDKYKNLKVGVKADHAAIYNTSRNLDDLYSVMGVVERNMFTGSRGFAPEVVGDQTVMRGNRSRVVSPESTIKAFETLMEGRYLPNEYDSSTAFSRVTVDEDNFNKLAKYTEKLARPKKKGKFINYNYSRLSLDDGAVLGKAADLNSYKFTQSRNYNLKSNALGSFTVSEKVNQALKAKDLGMNVDSAKLESFNLKKLNNVQKQISNLKNIVQGNVKSNKISKTKAKSLLAKKEKQAQDMILRVNKSIDVAKLEFQGAPNQDIHKMLVDIQTKIANKDYTNANVDIKNYQNMGKSLSFKPGDVLGVDANGMSLKLTDEFQTYSLDSLSEMRTSSAKASTLNFSMKGESIVGKNEYLKFFGQDSKEVVESLDNNMFIRAQAIASLSNKGLTIDENGTALLNSIVLTEDEVEQRLQAEITDIKSGNIKQASIIGSDKNSGTQDIKKLQNLLESNKDASGLISKDTFDDLFRQSESGRPANTNFNNEKISNSIFKMLDNGNGAADLSTTNSYGLSQMINTLYESKSSMSSLAGMQILGLRNARDLAEKSHVSNPYYKYYEQQLVDYLGVSSNPNMSKDDFVKYVDQEYTKKMTNLTEMYRGSNLIKNVADESLFTKENLKMFELAYKNEGESLHIASPDISNSFKYGSGKLEKGMSHNAQMQLIMNGFDRDLLGYIGHHNSFELYDLDSILKLERSANPEVTLNRFFEQKNYSSVRQRQFLSTLRSAAPEEINDILLRAGASQELIASDYLYYNISQNANEIETIPLPKRSTNRFGKYQVDSGRIKEQQLTRAYYDAVESNIAMKDNPGVKAFEDSFNNAVNTVKSSVVNTVTSPNNPALKGMLRLDAPNSSYSVVRSTQSQVFGDLVEKRIKKGYSTIGVSEEKAHQILKDYGMDIDLKDINKYVSREGLLQMEVYDKTSGSNLLVDLIAFENREPAQSGNSIRATKIFVGGMGTDSAKDSVFHHSKDTHYTKLMFGDYDLDHVLLYNFNRKLSLDDYQRVSSYESKMASNVQDLIELSEQLSVKGKKDKSYRSIGDSMLAVEQDWARRSPNPMVIGSTEYVEEVTKDYENYLMKASRKGSYRKTISPQVTQLATSLSETIDKMTHIGTNDITDYDKQVLRTINHNLVENLLKTQHIDTSTLPEVLPVEKVLQARKDFLNGENSTNISDNSKRYRNLLESEINRMFEGENKDPAIRAKHQHLIDALLDEASNDRRNGKEIANNILDIPSNAPKMVNDPSIRTTNKVIKEAISGEAFSDLNPETIAQGKSRNILNLEVKNTDIERTISSGYNELIDAAKRNYVKNKIPILAGAGALALGALMTQKDPNFHANKDVRADIGSMMLAPNATSMEQSRSSDKMLQRQGSIKTDYILPDINLRDIGNNVQSNLKLYGKFQDYQESAETNVKRAIFGNNISNVRINRTNDSYS